MKSDQYFRFGRTQMDEAMNELKVLSPICFEGVISHTLGKTPKFDAIESPGLLVLSRRKEQFNSYFVSVVLCAMCVQIHWELHIIATPLSVISVGPHSRSEAISGDDLVSKLRQNGFQLTVGDITFVLAESYGFCWGVERAVAMAYEARKFFPDKKIWAEGLAEE
eukprot:5386005-Amphidinium_carterae.1